METVGCPECRKNDSFGIKCDTLLGRDPNMYELIDMKPGSYVIWCRNCQHQITDINDVF